MSSEKIEIKVSQKIDWFNAKTFWTISEMEEGTEVVEYEKNIDLAFSSMNDFISKNNTKYYNNQDIDELKKTAFSFSNKN